MSMHIANLVKIPYYLLKLSSRNETMGVSRADNSVKLFVCVEVLRPSQPNGVMSSAVSLPNHTFTGQA